MFKAKNTVRKNEIDMCNGPIFGKMMLFTVPLICSNLLQLLFNAVDIIVVGRFAGENALAAVGSNTSLISLMTNFFIGLSIGVNVLAARYYGAKQKKNMSETVHTAMMLSVYSGLILTVVGCVGAQYILRWMSTPAEILPLATVYLRIYFLGMTATMIYNFGSAILRAVGDTKRSLYYLMAAGVINAGLNLLFVIQFHMGVAGVAIATVISQCVSAYLIVRCMRRETGDIHLEIRDMRISREKFSQILRIGIPAGFQGVVFSFSNVIIQSSVNGFGSVVVAGNTAAANIEGFVYVSMNAFQQAAIAFTGQNMGAGQFKRINKILYTAELSVAVVGLLMGNAALFFGRHLLGIYTSSPQVIAAGMARLGVVARTYALCGVMDVAVGVLRGMGYSVMPMVVSLVGACGLRVLWIFTFFRMEQFHTITSLYLTYPVTWIITLSAHFICYAIVRRKLPAGS